MFDLRRSMLLKAQKQPLTQDLNQTDHVGKPQVKDEKSMSQNELLEAVSERMRVREMAAVRRDKLRGSLPLAGFPF